MKIKPKNSKVLDRTKTIAATVAALGAAIGVSMGDVLAGPADLQVAESGKSALSRQKIKKPDVRSPKVERALKRRPSALAEKSSRPVLKSRPDVRANKGAPMLQKRPGTTSSKFGAKGTDLKK